jgi:hypothetical protein
LPPPDDVIVSSKGEVINLSTELTKRKSSKKKKATTATILFFLYGKISGVSYGIYYGVEATFLTAKVSKKFYTIYEFLLRKIPG